MTMSALSNTLPPLSISLSPVCGLSLSTLNCRLSTFPANSFNINTYEFRVRNSFSINTYKNKGLKVV
jgi:hypothetical protein